MGAFKVLLAITLALAPCALARPGYAVDYYVSDKLSILWIFINITVHNTKLNSFSIKNMCIGVMFVYFQI